ncbi:MAG: IS3 family transposase [Lachnospiraceae bacterium]|nr:IS3 family transposase [Lachnospiraceae bacterium]
MQKAENDVSCHKNEDGVIKGKISFCCRMLKVTRQGFYKYLANKDRPWKYQNLADAMRAVASEDECNDTYGRIRMYQALLLKQPEGLHIPGGRTVYRVMEQIGLSHRPKRKPNGITKADRKARKSGDLLKWDFTSAEPLKKCVTDITEIKAKDGKLYVSAIFDCFDAAVLGLSMDTNMKAELCRRTLENAVRSYPALKGAVIYSDRGSQYTSGSCRRRIAKYGILQSMNSEGGRCHDNARCESMWARRKVELIYGRHDTEEMTVEEVKTLIWRYFISYWNNRRICSANEGLPPMVRRQRYYESLNATT